MSHPRATSFSGRGGFAFKLGRNPDYHRMAPELLNEVELVRSANRVFDGLEFVDSGAAEGSFLEELWPGRRMLVGGAYAFTSSARRILQVLGGVRRLKHRVQGELPRAVLPIGALDPLCRLAELVDLAAPGI